MRALLVVVLAVVVSALAWASPVVSAGGKPAGSGGKAGSSGTSGAGGARGEDPHRKSHCRHFPDLCR